MKLVVCGCSWSSRDPNHPDTEFGHFLSQHYGYEYHNIARVGCDNFGIRLQIDYAIDVLKADIIVVNWTTACRVVWNHKGLTYSPTKGLAQLDYDVDSFCRNKDTHPCYNDPDFAPTIISQSITGLLDLENPGITYNELKKWWPFLEHHMSESQWLAFRSYYIHLYDDDLEAHKQYYLMESAVAKMQRNNVKFVFAPNTFNFKQSHAMNKNISMDDYEGTHRNPHDELYNEWEFVPSANLAHTGISYGLQWDFELMDDPINSPTHDHCHHLTAESQKRWAHEIAVPIIDQLLA